VMGSKNLKAIGVFGTKGIAASDGKRFMKMTDELIERTAKSKSRERWNNFDRPIWD
jgi:aldehyde:ferredoxin oxidoreductase